MKGRLEHDAKRETVILKLLATQPGYMRDYAKRFGSKTVSTKENYIRKVIEFLNYVRSDGRFDVTNLESLAKIKPSYINGYMELKKDMAPVTRANKLAAIKDFFDFLCDDEYIDNNPCNRIKPPKVEENIHVVSMTPDEINHVKNRVKNGFDGETSLEKARREKWRSRDLAIVTLGCSTGLRVSSITEINLEDIDFDKNIITVVVKGNKTRECVVGKNTMETIKSWINDRKEIMNGSDCNALFVSDRKTRISTCTVTRIVERGAGDLNKHITPHKMRSSCATNLYNATGDIYLVQEVLGHSNIKNTRRYAAVSNQKRQKAADILDNLG